MKKLICLVLIFVMMLTACSKWKVEIVDPTKPVENEQELVISEDKKELYIEKISAKKIFADNLVADGFSNGRGSSLAFQFIENNKALFFSYREVDPFVGSGVDIRIYLYDFSADGMEFIKELHFDEIVEVYVYERDGKAKVVFSNKYSTEVLSIDLETRESEITEIDWLLGTVSSTGLCGLGGDKISVSDIEKYNEIYTVESGEGSEFEEWSPNGEYMLVRKENSEMIYSLQGEKIAEFNATESENWCADGEHFIFSELTDEENGLWKSWTIDLSNGEKREIEPVSDALLAEKDFAVIKTEGKLLVKEYFTGRIFEITDSFGENNYYEKVVYNKESETIVAAAYSDGETNIWTAKLTWTEKISEKINEEENNEQSEAETEEPGISEENILPPVEGDFVVLETGKGFTMRDAVLEFENNFVIYSVGGEIAGFDKETGEKTYSTDYQNMNEIGFIDMYKNETENKNGEDYCISGKGKIQYRTSEELYIVHDVPEEAGDIFFVGSEDLLWASEEGIMTVDFHGEEEAKVLVETERIKQEIRPICKKTFEEGFVGDNGVPYRFEDPKFICNETKIVVTVVSEDYVFWAVAIYDIESDKFEKAFSFSEMDIAQYSIGDRYVFIRTVAGEKLVDAETLEERDFENFTGFAFMDGENIKFAVTELNNVGGGFKLYINESGKIEGEPVIKVTDPATSGYICGFTENYVLFHVYNAENEWDCAYRFS